MTEMNLQTIKKMKIPKLNVIEVEVGAEDEDLREKYRWSFQLDKSISDFSCNHSKRALAENKLLIHTFYEKELMPIPFVDKYGNRYPSKANLVIADVEYNFAYLMKVVQRFVIRTFKRSDEMYPHDHIIDKRELHLFYDNDLKQWLLISQKKFLEEQTNLDKLKGEIQRSTGQNYFKQLRLFFSKTKRHEEGFILKNYESFQTLFEHIEETIKATIEYHHMLFEIGEITPINYELIQEDICNVKNKIDKRYSIISKTGKDEYIYFDQSKEAILDLKKIFKPGYWITIEKGVYPNCGELYSLMQFANDNRNHHTKEKLGNVLLNLAKNKSDTYFIEKEAIILKRQLKR